MAQESLGAVALDWSVILGVTIIALLLANVPPDSHAFSVLDLSISYPHRDTPKVPVWLLVLLAIIVPVAFITCITFAVDTQTGRLTRRPTVIKNKLWSLNRSLKGLGISFGTAVIVYTGVKNLSGKPRPDFLAICQPKLHEIAQHTVGGYGKQISDLWVMVDRDICAQSDKMWLNDGLRSFPSGYATIAFAGLFYLTLWLSGRFNVTLPPLEPIKKAGFVEGEEREPLINHPTTPRSNEAESTEGSRYRPAYLLFLPYVPLGLAIFIAGTRYFDFRNHGFDVLAGSAVGTVTAWFGYRWCLPNQPDS